MSAFNNERWRFITPVLLSVLTGLISIGLFILTSVQQAVATIGQQLYHHQTNAEIHLPRAEMVELRKTVQENQRDLTQQLQVLLLELRKRTR